MTTLLIGPPQYSFEPHLTRLKELGLQPKAVAFPISEEEGPFDRVGLAFLVFPRSELMELGERLAQLRAALPKSAKIVVCAPRSNRKTLKEMGADSVVAPTTWDVGHVVERLSAEAIVMGAVQPDRLGRIVGATPAMTKLYREMEPMARMTDPILIQGETGTGKDLVAREIHNLSGRPAPYLAINCAALTPQLIESELFGHERAAFTGADQRRKGLLIEAGKGTLFLDEIGELDRTAQAKLLRMVEETEIRPVGSDRWVGFEARLVLATNRDLEKEMERKRFAHDLFERIQGFSLYLPPLRERKADIPILARHFLEQYNCEKQTELELDSGLLDPLFGYDWPGNVRQLRASIRLAATFASLGSRNISAVKLQESLKTRHGTKSGNQIPFDPETDTWSAVHDRAQTQYFKALLKLTAGNQKAAIQLSGIGKTQFYAKLKKVLGGDEEE